MGAFDRFNVHLMHFSHQVERETNADASETYLDATVETAAPELKII
jgi:hypothetical protein